MGTVGQTFNAATKKELRALAALWTKYAEKNRLVVELPYSPKRVKRTDHGYEIHLRAAIEAISPAK